MKAFHHYSVEGRTSGARQPDVVSGPFETLAQAQTKVAILRDRYGNRFGFSILGVEENGAAEVIK